ncbi:Hypothetical protein I595_953 [Croceitalea dokdonensis DOKDO 023]|uniref:Uncharacterized protein n=1 Tax=Croceitalea dokdonensis DOKDO 023 TaxID=1300341 RepID=A0A0P7AGH4_9FLAO|nr:hypothetical protein [Croceitalea dokdonensis]KPM32535.1 Hypothetical protein I595_953 [Croceitalea dokdonensis DOKDO 023]
MEEVKTQSEIWPLLSKIPKKQLTQLVEGYGAYAANFKYIYFSMLGFPAIVLGYNLFFGGKSYPYSEARNIENTFAIILCIYLVCFLVLAGLIVAKMLKVKKALRHTAMQHRLNKKAVVKEFHNFVKASIGGPGLK